ncbi:ribonuclease M5 [Rossellomorea vietnamensis]|uniref:Ribonuclease M5 n=1 Tax=Rossellomorea vietnamensis TaxID=218284 RepID=A0A5D4M7U0_9BACI|nr:MULTISPECIES: ribonuclease M5 [Bacillaceae]TYR97558.1 ribonuclease M5 [Rossellomorea vietnamensis]
MKIKEIIVVEGRDDTTAIRRAVTADTIETNGSAVSEETLLKIKHAQEKRGVIIFTDPDYPGERIRKIVNDHVPGCRHAFIRKSDALPKRGRGIGVEHASPSVIQEALKEAHVMNELLEEEISVDDLIAAGLIGGNRAKMRRERLGELLRIGYTNGKQLHKRLKMFEITQEEFAEAIQTILQEETDA